MFLKYTFYFYVKTAKGRSILKKAVTLLFTTSLLLTGCSNVDKSSVKVLNQVPEEKTNDIKINMAVVQGVDPNLRELIDKFNNDDNGYYIVMKDYYDFAEHNEEYSTLDMFDSLNDQLFRDIMYGEEVDIVFDGAFFSDVGLFDTLMEKGAFADLSTYLINDEELGEEELNQNVIELHKTDGHLYCLPTFYTIDTMVGTTALAGDKENWTFDEFVEKWNKMPEGSIFNGTRDKQDVLLCLLDNTLSSFYDIKNGTASFDSIEFKKILEFSNRFLNSEMKSDADIFASDFANEITFRGFGSLSMGLKNDFGEETTLVGYPSYDGNGAIINSSKNRYAICEKSSEDVKKGAWLFLRKMYMEDYQYTNSEQYFPINNKAFDKLAEELKKDIGTKETVKAQGAEIEICHLTAEEYTKLINYVKNANKVNANSEREIKNVVLETVLPYFNEETDIDSVIKELQNKINLYLSEKQ